MLAEKQSEAKKSGKEKVFRFSRSLTSCDDNFSRFFSFVCDYLAHSYFDPHREIDFTILSSSPVATCKCTMWKNEKFELPFLFLSSPPHAIRSSAKKVNTSSRHFLLSQLTGAEPTKPDRRQQDTPNDWGLYVIRRVAWKADIGRGSHVLSPTGSVDVVPLSRGSTSCRKSDIKLMSVDVNSQHKAYLWLIYDSIYLW